MNKISCFAVSKITSAVKGNKTGGQNNNDSSEYRNSISGNGSSGGTPLLKRSSKVSSVPDIEIIQEVIIPRSTNLHPSVPHHTSISSIPNHNHNYTHHVYHNQLSQPSSPMLPMASPMAHHRGYTNHQHHKMTTPSSPQLSHCNNFYPFPSTNCPANVTSTSINEMLNGKHRYHGSRTSIHPPSSPSLSHHGCKSPNRQRKILHPYSNEVINGYSTMEVRSK